MDPQKVDIAVKRILWDVGADVDGADAAAWGDEGTGAYPYVFDTAYALYRELIAPISEGLKGKRHVFFLLAGHSPACHSVY